tara:strand:- start:1147 stop:1599 length:453 start_codon:yes stop_codon:yes gene_type:complete
MSERGQLQDYSVDQAAGAIVLVLGAVASLLLVIWQSRCHCKCNLCYLFQCERRPPNEEELKGLKDKAKELAEKAKKDKDKDKPPLPAVDPDPMTSPPPQSQVPEVRAPTPLVRQSSASFSNARDSLDGMIEPEPQSQSPDEPVASAWKKL